MANGIATILVNWTPHIATVSVQVVPHDEVSFKDP
jgi:hypothetical protein